MKGYTLVEKLGQGGMGIVYRAIQLGLKREVALKVLPEDASEDEGLVQRFHREFKTISNLHHPNIVRVFDFGEHEGVLWYAMELVAGTDLHGRGAQPFALVAPLLEQAADALAYLHEHGLWHRDIKPQNLCVDATGRLVLLDFGLVKPKESTLITMGGDVIGTLRYLAPEAILGEPVQGPADVYALALTAQELLTGHYAIDAYHQADLLNRIARGELAPWPPGLALPPWFVDLHARAVARAPADRPTAAQYRDAFRESSAAHPLRAPQAETPRPARVRPSGEKNRTRPTPVPARGRLLALAGLLMMVATAAAVLRVWPKARSPVPVAQVSAAPSGVASPAPAPLVSDAACARRLARTLLVWPTERSVFVDFDVPGGLYHVEVGDWTHRTVTLARACPATRGFVQVEVDPLVSDTDHFVRVRREGGGVILGDHRFRTRPAGHALAVQGMQHEVRARPHTGGEVAEFFQQFPDPRGVAALLPVAGVQDPGSIMAYGKITMLARKLRNEDLGRALVRQLPKVGQASLRSEILLAAVQARVPEAMSQALAESAVTTRTAGAEAAARAAELSGGAPACDAIARMIERFPAATRFGASMVYAEPASARAHAERWLRPGAPESELGAAMLILVELGDDAAVVELARALDNPPSSPAPNVTEADRLAYPELFGWYLAPRVAEALATLATPAARAALTRAFARRPEDATLLLAAVHAGATDAIPQLERLAAHRTPALRREAVAGLASCAPAAASAALRRALADSDPEVATAAAWGLSRAPATTDALTISVPAAVTYVHTGVFVRAGQSIELSANGSWGRAGSDPRPVDISIPLTDQLPPLGITAIVGPTRWRVARRPGRLLALKDGELLLSPWQHFPDPAALLTRPPLVGQAYVSIVR